MKDIDQMVTTFLAAGGLGYINFWILEKQDLTNGNENGVRITLSTLLFSLPDFFIYLFLKWAIKKNSLLPDDVINFIALIVTIALVFVFTAKFGESFVKSLYNIIHYFTTGSKIMGVVPGEPWTKIREIESDQQKLVYLYKLDKEPIIFGLGEAFSADTNSNYSLNLKVLDKVPKQPSFDELRNFITDEKLPIEECEDGEYIYRLKFKSVVTNINFKQNFIIVVFTVNCKKIIKKKNDNNN